MRIAQIAPLIESVPPRLYGGTERIVSWLTEELVRQGHAVTLVASGDSATSADLLSCTTESIRLSDMMRDDRPHTLMMADRVRRLAEAFDVLHFHIDLLHFPLFRGMAHKTLTTLHGRQDSPDLWSFYRTFPDMPLVSISEAQRAPIRDANVAGTVHHGLPADLHRPSYDPRGGYVAFLGRIAPEKRPDRAIRIARALGIPLKIAAKVDDADSRYFENEVGPLLRDGDDVTFVGEVDERAKTRFLGEARALLFPIDWPEPFGLVLIEAMACGTPVLAFRHGSVPEVVDEGVTGRIVDSVEEAIAVLPAVMAMDRRKLLRRLEERFTAERMARDYVELYARQAALAGCRGMPAAVEAPGRAGPIVPPRPRGLRKAP